MTLSVFQWASAQVRARPLNGGLQEETEADMGGLQWAGRPELNPLEQEQAHAGWERYTNIFATLA